MEKNKVARDQGEQPVERGGKQLMLRRAREKEGHRYKRIPSLSGSLGWLPGVSVHQDAPPSWLHAEVALVPRPHTTVLCPSDLHLHPKTSRHPSGFLLDHHPSTSSPPPIWLEVAAPALCSKHALLVQCRAQVALVYTDHSG